MPSSYALGEHFESFIRQQVKTGRYASASEVVRDAIRLLKDREEEREAALEGLRRELDKGLDSGNTYPAEEVFEHLKRKYRDIAKSSSP